MCSVAFLLLHESWKPFYAAGQNRPTLGEVGEQQHVAPHAITIGKVAHVHSTLLPWYLRNHCTLFYLIERQLKSRRESIRCALNCTGVYRVDPSQPPQLPDQTVDNQPRTPCNISDDSTQIFPTPAFQGFAARDIHRPLESS
jgi:hypothetical protein